MSTDIRIYILIQEPQSHTARPRSTEHTKKTTKPTHTEGVVFKVTISTWQGSTNTSQKQRANQNNHHFTPIILPVVLCKTTLLSLGDVTVGAKVENKKHLVDKALC